MANSRPSSAPLSRSAEPWDLSMDRDPITGQRGANQLVVAPSRDDQSRLSPNANRVQQGQLPRTSGPASGKPDAANPLGRGGSSSLNG